MMKKILSVATLTLSACFLSGTLLAHNTVPQVQPHASQTENTMTIVKVSNFDFATTRTRILNEIKKRNLTLFAELNHSAAAKANGLIMPETTVVVFGNPKAGTQLMLEHPSLALDLPYRVLIAQRADGKVQVSSPSPDSFRVHHLSDQQIASLAKMPGVIDAALQP